MAFRGGFLAQAWQSVTPEPLHTADPAHSENEPGVDSYTYTAHGGVAAPEYLDDYVDDWVVAETPGLQIDTTPTSHEDGMGTEAYRSDVQLTHAQTVAHMTDYGSARRATYAPPVTQFADERYIGKMFSGLGPIPMDPVVVQRGLNGLPENNPDGYPLGHISQFWVDRKFAIGERMHDQRYTLVNTADVVRDQPAGAEGAVGSPFDGLARAITRTWQRPMVRREPPSIDNSETTDGESGIYAAETPWVVG
jgi:hypothetical protein